MAFKIEQCFSGCRYFEARIVENFGADDRAEFGCKLCTAGGVAHLEWDTETNYAPIWFDKFQTGQLFQIKRQCFFPSEYPIREDTW